MLDVAGYVIAGNTSSLYLYFALGAVIMFIKCLTDSLRNRGFSGALKSFARVIGKL